MKGSPRIAIPSLLALTALAGMAGAAPGPPSRRAPSPPLGPVEESLSERRAVRGVPVDDGAGESPELRELRRFEEQAFPRGGGFPRADGATPPPPSLPGQWAGSGDVPPELRSPDGPSRAAPPAPPAPDSDWLRGLKMPELPVRWDPQVVRYLDYFKSDTRGRAVMSAWLRRAGRFRDLFERTLDRQGLPKDLLYVAMVESGFDTGSRSRTGAGGVWQFMPGAARAYGLEVSYWVDARRDPERAAAAAARYLKDLYVRFGSWPLVFAAYNAGYGAVLRSITNYNTNDYWELIRHESGLPWESSIYVPKILAAAVVGHNLEAFGFAEVTPDPAFAFDEVDAPPGTALATVARAAGARVEVIEALNPHLFRGRTPPDRGATRVRIPPGTAQAYAESFDKARASDKVETVVLRFGETLDDLARARGLAARELRRLNGLKDSAELRAGVTVVVPRRDRDKARAGESAGAGGGATSGAAAGALPAGAGEDEADDTTLVAVPDRVFSYEGRERVFYRTRDGDALDEIAETLGVRADDLCEWNNLDASAKLHPRMVLQVFVAKDFDAAGVLLVDPATVRVVTLGSDEFLELETARRGKKRLFYTTRTGDTLARVGRRYGLSTGDLARINRFSYNTELHEGQRIVVYSPTAAPARETTAGRAPEPQKRPASPARPALAAGSPPGSSASLGAKKASGAAAAATSTTKTPVAASVRMMPPRAVATSKPAPAAAAAGNKKK